MSNNKSKPERNLNSPRQPFNIIVAATMSAGKTSLINALLGTDLLWSANEAATASITRIHHTNDADTPPRGDWFNWQNECSYRSHHVDRVQLREWNDNPLARLINLHLNIDAFSGLNNEVVIYDTPGANNSQDSSHEKLFNEALKDCDSRLIIYVLNATQIGTHDDARLLSTIKQHIAEQSKKQIIFVLNKVDALDEEKGESLDNVLHVAERYLENAGFHRPVIIAAKMHASLVAKKVLANSEITRAQKNHLNGELALFDENIGIAGSNIPNEVIARINKETRKLTRDEQQEPFSAQNLHAFIIRSGLGALSQYLRYQIETYTVHSVLIEYNPLIPSARLCINGVECTETCELGRYMSLPLQRWIDFFFTDLRDLMKGATRYDITFKGMEIDFNEFENAAATARLEGMEIDLCRIENGSPAKRLSKMKALAKELQQYPEFVSYLEGNAPIQRKLNEALNDDYQVWVIGAMSAGKSMLVNAMLGQDLMPVANEADTAAFTNVYDDKFTGGRFFGSRDSAQGEQEFCKDITLETLKAWNLEPDTKTINLNGNIVAMHPREHVRLVLTDTPGPNNSQDSDHELTAMSFIKDSAKSNPLIIYVLNATQLGTNDDRNLLSLVAEIMEKGGKQNKERFIFVVNKIDMFDPEAGEDVGAALDRVRNYLENNGIKSPQIYPVSTYLTRLLRKSQNPRQIFTRRERSDLANMTELFLEEESMNLPVYMPLSARAKNIMTQQSNNQVLIRSGLPAIEAMIVEYHEKYTLTSRINSLNEIISAFIKREHNKLDRAERTTSPFLPKELSFLIGQLNAVIDKKVESSIDLLSDISSKLTSIISL